MPTDHEILALHRYHVWADRMRWHLDETLRNANTEAELLSAQFIDAYMPYWYAGLYVVVEGWKRLKLTDPEVDPLLDAEHLKILKSYRHGVFHFHPSYYDPKFRGIWAQGREAEEWVRSLDAAFGKFFERWVRDLESRQGEPK